MRDSKGALARADISIHSMIAAGRGMTMGEYWRWVKSAGAGRPPPRGYGKYRGRTPDYVQKVPVTQADHERIRLADIRRIDKAQRQAKGFVGYAAVGL